MAREQVEQLEIVALNVAGGGGRNAERAAKSFELRRHHFARRDSLVDRFVGTHLITELIKYEGLEIFFETPSDKGIVLPTDHII